jgi:hypothetical protein
MNQIQRVLCKALITSASLLMLSQEAGAQPFNVNLGDLCLGFRKVSPFTENNEAVVNIGSVLTLVNMSAGASNNVTGYSPSQLTPDTFTSLSNLTWSAFCGLSSVTLSGYPVGTLWVTKGRSTFGTQSSPPDRLDQGQLQSVDGIIDSITFGGMQISARYSAGPDNTTTYVKEPLNLPNVTQGQNLGAYISGSDATKGTFEDNWVDKNFSPVNAEISTPIIFSSPVQSDLYQVVPKDFTDPNNGQTSGKAYYVGYFQLNPDGTMFFIRASANVPAPTIKLVRTGTSDTISFLSTSGVTYKLYSSTDLTTPRSGWGQVGGTITGDGNMKSFPPNTTSATDTPLFYRVTAQ